MEGFPVRAFSFRNRLAAIFLAGACSSFIMTCARADEDGGPPARAPAAASQWIVIPSGIADTAGKIGYVTSISDGVEALDLVTGHPIWETKKGHRPVALAGNRLIALEPRGAQSPANTMSVAVFETDSGELVLRSRPIVLPDWIAVEGGIGLGFASTLAVEGNTLKIQWHAWRQFAGGVPPTPEAVSAARKDDTGVAEVDLTSGEVAVEVDRVPNHFKPRSLGKFTDVGEKRLVITERQEKVPGGVQLIHRTLEASDIRSGRPLWQHEIASDLIVPANIPAAAQTQQLQRR
jgi:hypothetical protein